MADERAAAQKRVDELYGKIETVRAECEGGIRAAREEERQRCEERLSELKAMMKRVDGNR